MIEWRPVPGFGYSVSSFGDVRRDGPSTGARVGRVLKPHLDHHGYFRLHLYRASKGTLFTVHALVAWAFIGTRPTGLTVNHRNGVKTDNRIANLEYLTQADNNQHAYDSSLRIANNSKKTHCPRGHAFDEGNTYVTNIGERQCRACHRVRQRRQYDKRRASFR